MMPMKIAGTSNEATGYLHHRYAESLSEVGRPRQLPRCGGWLLERPIPASSGIDLIGCYPLFVCSDWSALSSDLADLSGAVSLVAVTDPFGPPSADLLERAFDEVTSYKAHFVVDLRRRPISFVCAHHRRRARTAKRAMTVCLDTSPLLLASIWVELYGNLIRRHGIRGIPDFSEDALRVQLGVPGIVTIRAIVDEKTIAMLLWYVQGEVAYYHLGASSDAGYQLSASYALFWDSLEYFAETGVRWLCLGGGAGIRQQQPDGLVRFKQGWSTGTRPTYLCTRVFDRDAYRALLLAQGPTSGDYFPAYRADSTHRRGQPIMTSYEHPSSTNPATGDS